MKNVEFTKILYRLLLTLSAEYQLNHGQFLIFYLIPSRINFFEQDIFPKKIRMSFKIELNIPLSYAKIILVKKFKSLNFLFFKKNYSRPHLIILPLQPNDLIIFYPFPSPLRNIKIKNYNKIMHYNHKFSLLFFSFINFCSNFINQRTYTYWNTTTY